MTFSLFKISCLLCTAVLLIAAPWTDDRALITDQHDVQQGFVRRLNLEHLPNAIQLHPKVISGGTPQGPQGFQQLAQQNVKTIISVDGLKPDLVSAQKQGLKYVHLPHGYDGISANRIRDLAKAIHELPGPIYIHCHHGRHRSPAAAVSACITLGYLSPKAAESILRTAGTSPQYAGLYQAVALSHEVPKSILKQHRTQFHSVVELPPIVDVMTQLELLMERLDQHQQRGWQNPTSASDQTAAHDALLLQELFTELHRDPDVRQRSIEFQKLLTKSTHDAKQLHEQLRTADFANTAVTKTVAKLRKSCTECHHRFRN